ncbi:hypothetical protein XELAEV_18037234mg [Xenopus laevis]|uniref:Uncharacterized protein n=1 Tax=Xenopus laevis TaxID=8355 RepID=A0A974HA77_XENLA|nr:hypothetical protein XELAEV_18037234mg [Xenopus laevis]
MIFTYNIQQHSFSDLEMGMEILLRLGLTVLLPQPPNTSPTKSRQALSPIWRKVGKSPAQRSIPSSSGKTESWI